MTRHYIHNELKKIHRTANEIESILASEVIFLDELPSAEKFAPEALIGKEVQYEQHRRFL